jgi:hypothetical protein
MRAGTPWVFHMRGTRLNPLKENVRRGIVLATQRFRKKEIAAIIGCAPQTLSSFIHGGPLGPQFLSIAEQWLCTEGFWPEEGQSGHDPRGTGPEVSDIVERTGVFLQELGSLLRDTTIPAETRLTFLRANLEPLSGKLLPDIEAMLREKREGGEDLPAE